MNVIEAKIYLLQAPGVNRVRDVNKDEWYSDTRGMFFCTFRPNGDAMHNYAPFTKVEPEKTNQQIAVDIAQGNMPEATTILEILDAVDDKIRRAKV